MQRAGAWTAVWAPISLATIAAVLRRDQVECRLDDCIIERIGEHDLLERARAFCPDLFVINTATPSIVSDLQLADRLKREFPRALILAIGIHVSALSEDSLKMSAGLDAVARGEPELTVREAAAAWREGKTLDGIPGLSFKDRDGIRHNPDREPSDLDSLPSPAWDLVRRELYRLPFTNRPFLLIGTSRGCPYHCRFCADPAYYGHRLRTRSPSRIVGELREARDHFGTRDFLFWSESFTLKREWSREALEAIIGAELGVRFVVNSRSDHVDPGLLRLLKKAGCWMIGFGLESGDQGLLDLMDKKITVEQNRQAVLWAKEAGLQVTAHLTLGFPGETRASALKTIELACSLPLDFAQFYTVVPFPGSPLYNEAREQGWLQESAWERFEQNFALLSTPELSRDELAGLRRLAYRRFYLNPARAFRVLTTQVGFRGLPRFLGMVKSFREWM